MGTQIRYTFGLLILLSLLIGTTANAATRKHVSMPSASSVANSSGSAISRSGNDLSIAGELIGEYIPASGTGTKGTPIKVLPTLDYSIPRTINAAKSLLKNNLAKALLGAVIGGAVASVDWVMTDGAAVGRPGEQVLVKKTPGMVSGLNVPFLGGGSGSCSWYAGKGYGLYSSTGSLVTSSTWLYMVASTPYTSNGFNYTSNCGHFNPPIYVSQKLQSTPQYVLGPDSQTAITDTDFPALDPYLNGLGPNMLHDLLKETCKNSPSPDACFQEMKERSRLSGPATVEGPTTTTTTNSTSPSGVSSQTVTTKTTNFNITYGDTYFDFQKKTTTSVSVDGMPASETEEEEATEPTEEIPEEEEQEEKPKRLATAGSCEASVFCSGDAIDCAVLNQAKQHRCDDEARGDFPKNKAAIQSLVSGSQFAADPDEQIEVPSFINQGARFLPAACPPPTDISLMSFGGHSFQLKFDPMCSLAELLAPLVVIVATLFAALYVGRSFGGE